MNQGQSAVPNLLGMARTAVEARNDEEAISYFNRVLETDPTVSEAWLGKGRAVARLSSLRQPRLREMVVAFGHAIGSADENDRAAIAAEAISDLTKATRELFRTAQAHWMQYRDVGDAWATCVTVGIAGIEALEAGLPWRPDYLPAQLEIILISSALINEGVSPESEAALRAHIDRTTAAIRALDPNYAPPPLQTESNAVKAAKAIEAQAQANDAQANSDAWGIIILFVIAIVGGLFVAATRASH